MRIDCLLRERKNYTFEYYVAHQLGNVLDHSFQIIYLSDCILQDYLIHIQKSPPSWTLAFTDLFPQKKPFCDVIQLPHFFWVEGSLSSAVHYLWSSYATLGFSDRAHCQRLAKPNLRFLPTGIDPNLANRGNEKRLFDVVLFADLVDSNNTIKSWQTLFSDEVVTVLKRAIHVCEKHVDLLPIEAVMRSLKEIEIAPDQISLNDLIYGVENYLKANRNRELISSFEGVRLDVFGEHVGNNWLKRLKNSEWIYLHADLPYTEHFEVLKLSKVVVFDSIDCEKWFLAAIATGCLPLANPTPYLRELLGDNEAIWYAPKDWKALLQKVRFFLDHPEKREGVIDRLREELLPHHSWEKRAKELLSYLT